MKSFIEVQYKNNKSLDNKDQIFKELVSLIDNSNSNRLIIIIPLNTIEFYQLYYLYSLFSSFNNKISLKQFPEKGDKCYIEPFPEVFIFNDYTEDYISQMEGTGIDPYIKRVHLRDINSNKIEKHLLNDKTRIIKTERTNPKGNVQRPSFKNLEANDKFQKFFNEDENYNFENLNNENIFVLNRSEKNKHSVFLEDSEFINKKRENIPFTEFPNSFINKQNKRVFFKNKSQLFENATVFEHTSNLSNLNLSNDYQTLFSNNISLVVDKDSWVERFTNKNKIVFFLHPNQINQINLIKKQEFSVILFGNDIKTNAILKNSTSKFENKLAEKINNFKEFDYQFVKYVDSDFDKICNVYFELTKNIKNIDEFDREILSNIRTTLFKANELLSFEHTDKYAKTLESFKIFSDTLEINKFDLDVNKSSTYEKLRLLLKDYLSNNNFFPKKIDEIEEYLKVNSDNTLVILPENEINKQQLENKFPKSSFFYLKDFMNRIQNFEKFNLMLISCYIKKNYLHKIIFSQISKKIIFICNNFEHNYYKNYFSKKAWYEIVKFDSNSDEKLNIFGKDYITIDSKDQAEEALVDDKLRIINLDEYLDRPIFEISNADEEKVIPLLAKFQCGGMAYLYENHEYQLIHQNKDEDYEISKTLSSNFQYDDIVILRNTGDKEIYEEESKRVIQGNDYQELDKISKKWKKLLNDKFNSGQGFDTDHILSKLKEVGFTKQRSTLQNWLYGNVRCPEELIDLRLINEICDKKFNEIELLEIFNAANLINSTHQSVGRGFTKKIHIEIEKSLNESLLVIENERIRVDIDKNGKVILGGDNSDNPEGWVLKIDTINTTNFSVPSSHMNRLYIP